MNILKTAVASRWTRVAAVAGLAAAGVVGLAGSGSAATAATYTASPLTGPGTQVIAVTGTGFINTAGVVVAKKAEFQAVTTCGAQGTGTDATASLVVTTATRLVVKASSLATAAAGKAWKICVYDGSGTPVLLGSATYTAFPAPGTPTMNVTSGPDLGGIPVVVSASGLTSKSTASVGGIALGNPKVDTTAGTISGTLPAIAPGQVAVSVTSEGGTTASASTYFTVDNAITVAPNRIGTAAGTGITITGVGFKNAFASVTPKVVFLGAAGAYDSTNNPGTACTSITVVSDTEIVCKAPALSSTGAYSVWLTDSLASPTFDNVFSSGSTVTVAAY